MTTNRDALVKKYDLSHSPGPFNTDNPVVEQIEAAMRPESDDEGKPRTYSPHARLLPEVSAALDVALSEPTTLPDVRWLEEHAQLNYRRSNLPDRRVCDTSSLAEVLPMSHAEDLRLYRAGLAAAITGPYGLRGLVLIESSVPMYEPPLPWRWREYGAIAPTRVRFPVSHGYSTLRVARIVLHLFAQRCYWCEQHGAVGQPDWGMVVSAAATTFVFPTCGRCRSRFAREFAPDCVSDEALLSYIASDGWHESSEWPADRHC